MLFQILDEHGVVQMWTSAENAIPDDEELKQMHQRGYRFKINGKGVPFNNVRDAIKADIRYKEPVMQIKQNTVKKKEQEVAVEMPAEQEQIEQEQITLDTEPALKETTVESPAEKPTTTTKENNTTASKENKASNTKENSITDIKENKENKKAGGKIKCVETGKEYNTQAEIVRELGVNAGLVSQAVRNGKKVKGLTFIKE